MSIGQHVIHPLPLVSGPRRREPLLLFLAGLGRDEGRLLLDLAHDLLLGARVEDVAGLAQQQLEVLGHVSAGHVDAPDGGRHREAFVHRHRVRYAVARVQYQPGCSPRRVE